MNKKEIGDIMLTRLEQERENIRSQWAKPEGSHTRYFVIDDFLPEDFALNIYKAFPRSGDGFFHRKSFREKKKTLANISEAEPIFSAITYAFQGEQVVETIAELLGFSDLMPDPTLYAGGLSMMCLGDFLNPHIDNSHDGKRQYYRRLNLLYYVSPDWTLENGGNFELWDVGVTNPKIIVSKFNRLVAIETNKTSWHSVSKVVVDRPRCCVSNYFFSPTSPDKTEYFHVTSFMGRPEEKMKRLIGRVDNGLRNTVAKVFKVGRGQSHVNMAPPNEN